MSNRAALFVPHFVVPLFAALVASGCASSEPAAPPAPIRARVSRVFPKTQSLTKSVMEVKVEMLNPRATPVAVESIRYSLDTGEVAGEITGTVPAGATLEAEQQAELGFSIEVPLPEERLEELISMEVVPADLSGEIRFGDGSTAPFSKKSGLAMPSLPKFIVQDAQAAQYERKRVDVTFFLRLVNENSFTLPIQVVEYEVVVAGKTMRNDQAGVGSRLTPGAAEEYEVNAQLDDSFEGLDEILASGVINYTVKGQVTARGLEVPFEHDGAIDLGASED